MNVQTLLKIYPQRFQYYGNDTYAIYLDKHNHIMFNSVDGMFQYYISNALLKKHVQNQNETEFLNDVGSFVKWIVNEFDFQDCENNVYGFESSSSEEDDKIKTNKKYLYDQLRNDYIKKDTTRDITIYTWGKKHRKRVPFKIDANFNASMLSGKRKGLNLKKLNGLSIDVQRSVETSKNFGTFFTQMVEKIERIDAHAIGINCTAGRHRSVTCAQILKREFYPNATIRHLELKKIT